MKEEITKILDSLYGGYIVELRDEGFEADKERAVEELSNLIQKEREEAVRGFVEYQKFVYNRLSEMKFDESLKATPSLDELADNYLSQTKGGKE